ncbi:hypothetical protein Pan258_55380 [Symmachiella dynata]|nr:hypothetical protein Pan258_55380 [Symmachiella dynata]
MLETVARLGGPMRAKFPFEMTNSVLITTAADMGTGEAKPWEGAFLNRSLGTRWQWDVKRPGGELAFVPSHLAVA